VVFCFEVIDDSISAAFPSSCVTVLDANFEEVTVHVGNLVAEKFACF
jgi:hypothetical protein